MRSTARALALWLWTLLILVAILLVSLTLGDSLLDALIDSGGFAVVPPVFTAMGALVLGRQPGNRIGWLLLYIGFGVLLVGAGEVFTPDSADSVDGLGDVLLLAWANVGYFLGLLFPLILFLYWYPTGEVMEPRWRWGVWLLGVAIVGSIAREFLTREVVYPDQSWSVANPIGFLGPVGSSVAGMVMGVAFLGSLAGGLTAIIVRFRRSTGVVRQQIKWVAFSLVVFVLLLLFDIFLGHQIPEYLLDVPFVLSIVFVPVSIAIAITRYRLYDIDRLLSRTVAYAAVVGILALVYVTGAVWLPTTLVDGEAPLFVAASTLAVAALFNPLRLRVLAWVDRRFYRSRYDGERVVALVVGRIRDETDLDKIVEEAVDAVAETMQPDSVGVWLKEPVGDRT